MNNDRELLEFAANAVGIDTGWINGFPHTEDGEPWDPLIHDGAAFRLAVELRLDIMFFSGSEEVICSGPNETDENVIEPYGGDIDAAVRRAIVRAAAEIGRVMK